MAEQVERRLVAILSADVAGYTRLVHADEEGTLARFRAHRTELAEPKIAEHRGRIVKLMGDGFLVEFPSVVDAVRCAAEIQRGMAARNAGIHESEKIAFRIGINLGDVIVEDDDIYGDGVNIATRMQEITPPGGVSVSGVVHDSVRDKLSPAFEDLGPQHVKNITEPVRAYRVVLEPEASHVRAAAPDRSAVSVPPTGRVTAILSSSQRRGAWHVPKKLRVIAVMGSVELDFREAEFGPGVTEIEVTNVMGSVGITAPSRAAVKCDGVGILGQFDSVVTRTGVTDPHAPVLRISGVALMAQTSAR